MYFFGQICLLTLQGMPEDIINGKGQYLETTNSLYIGMIVICYRFIL
jgi:hypothetical protein